MPYELDKINTKTRHPLKIRALVIGILSFLTLILTPMFGYFFFEFHNVSKNAEKTTEELVPYILKAQKAFINIDNLRFLMAEIRESTKYTAARNAFYSAQTILIDMGRSSGAMTASDRSELQRQLQMFWYKRLRLEGLRSRYMDDLSEIVISGLEISTGENNERSRAFFLECLRNMTMGFGNASIITEEEISAIRRMGSAVTTRCRFDGRERGLEKPCKRFEESFRKISITGSEIQENLIEFNVIYDYLRGQLNNMILEASSYENKSISSYLNEKQQFSERAEIVAVVCIIVLILLQLVIYQLVKGVLLNPMNLIVRLMRIAMSRQHKPKNFPKSSRVTEFNEIFGMLEKTFDNLYQSQDEVKQSNKNYLKLLDVSLRDELTGTLNRRALENFISRNAMIPSGLCVMMVDIDHFKHFNDERGHQYGDYILKLIAATLMNSLSEKSNDRVFRFGGEEFVIMVQSIESRMRKPIAERLCERVRALQIPNSANDSGFLTVSIGCSTVTTGDSSESVTSLISQADMALYEAKSLGRNRVILAKRTKVAVEI